VDITDIRAMGQWGNGAMSQWGNGCETIGAHAS
jgi:hypothetical protein